MDLRFFLDDFGILLGHSINHKPAEAFGCFHKSQLQSKYSFHPEPCHSIPQGSEGKSWQHFAPMPGAPNARNPNTIEKLQGVHLKNLLLRNIFIGQDQAFDGEQAVLSTKTRLPKPTKHRFRDTRSRSVFVHRCCRQQWGAPGDC